jgi:hypothetical protein
LIAGAPSRRRARVHGNPEAPAAVIASLIETCKLAGVEPQAYLTDCHGSERRGDDVRPGQELVESDFKTPHCPGAEVIFGPFWRA